MKKRLLSMLLAIVMVVGLVSSFTLTAFAAEAPTYSGGSGTEDDPYLLATANDLVALKDFVISGGADYLDAVDECGLGTYHGYYFKLTKDIDMSGIEAWTPFNFNGTFDGAGHTISNMQMNENFFESADPEDYEYKSDEYETAFFSQVVHATIKNLYFDNCTAKISDGLEPSSDRDIYVGIVAATAIASSFENVSATNCTLVQNGENANFAYSGGLVGYADICHFEYCSFDGTITIGGDAIERQNAGGLVGGWGDIYSFYVDDYGMKIGAGKDFGIYNSFSTAEINNPCFFSSAGIVGFLCTDFIPATFENLAFGGKITAGGRASGIIGEAEENDNYINCVVYADEITTSDRACVIGMYFKDSTLIGVTENVTGCKISDKTNISGTKGTILNDLTAEPLETDEEKIENFKSNLYGKLADGSENVTITLSQEGEVKYTATTDADGEYNFGKQVLRGDYTLNIAASDAAKAYEKEITIDYATNHELDITREIKLAVTFEMNGYGTAPASQNVDNGDKVTEPEAPTANGYVFGGWYKETDCINQWNFDTDTVTDDTTLYAKWTACDHSDSTSKPTCTDDAICSICGGTITATDHTYDQGNWKNDKDNHWRECACGATADLTAHAETIVNYREATTTEKGYTGDTVCEICRYEIAKGEDIPVKVVPNTGDNSNTVLWFALMVMSVLGLAGVTVLGKKRTVSR